VGLHAATLLAFMPSLLPTVPPAFYDAVPPPVAFILSRAPAGPFRVYWEAPEGGATLPAAAVIGGEPAPPGSAAALAFGQRRLGPEFVGRTFGLQYAFDTGWEGGALRSIQERADALRAAPRQRFREMLDEDGVRFVVGTRSHPDLVLLTRLDGLERRPVYVYENATARPRVEGPPGTELRRFTAGSYGAVTGPAGGTVRISENGYPLWRARLDGRSHPIASAPSEHEIRIDVPPGRHELHVRLEPWDVRIGLLLGVLGMGGLLWMDRRGSRVRSPPARGGDAAAPRP
jgi:hypothetical protein